MVAFLWVKARRLWLILAGAFWDWTARDDRVWWWSGLGYIIETIMIVMIIFAPTTFTRFQLWVLFPFRGFACCTQHKKQWKHQPTSTTDYQTPLTERIVILIIMLTFKAREVPECNLCLDRFERTLQSLHHNLGFGFGCEHAEKGDKIFPFSLFDPEFCHHI